MTSETEKLFYKDQYIKEFEGKVLEVTERGWKISCIFR